MSNIDEVIKRFLADQNERLKQRTYRDYESVIELFQIYLNDYAYTSLNEHESREWESHYQLDHEAFTKLFGVDKIRSSTYSEFFEYFIIRKVASGESFMKTAVRVMKKFTNWLFENSYLDRKQYSTLKEYFDKDHDKVLPKAEKVSDLVYEHARTSPKKNYEEILEGYFTIVNVESKKLWVDDMFSERLNIGPLIVTKQISDLCKEGWDIYLVIGKYKNKWYILESGNVYPIKYD